MFGCGVVSTVCFLVPVVLLGLGWRWRWEWEGGIGVMTEGQNGNFAVFFLLSKVASLVGWIHVGVRPVEVMRAAIQSRGTGPSVSRQEGRGGVERERGRAVLQSLGPGLGRQISDSACCGGGRTVRSVAGLVVKGESLRRRPGGSRGQRGKEKKR